MFSYRDWIFVFISSLLCHVVYISLANLGGKIALGNSIQGNWFLNVKWVTWKWVSLIYSLVAHAYATRRTNRTKAGGKEVKGIAYWCLRWRTEISANRNQEPGWWGKQDTAANIMLAEVPIYWYFPSHLCGYLLSFCHHCSTSYNTQASHNRP